ncbi:MAG TPA: MFS transporter [Anaerolineales bacterium]|nr:MFS transporter [Anaerolineales bacterium]
MQSKSSLPAKTWIAIILLGFSGQLAWGVENQYYNTFMYNKITPDPRPISWMVAASAVAATLTTILMGTLSDRTRSGWGRRRPFIVFGYLAWGIFTAIYPLASFFHPVMLAVGMAILFDCIMTFFGSTANDASLNAYITDVTSTENRGRVMSVVELLTWVAILVVYGGSGPIIDKLGYFVFFYAIGGLVLVLGLVGSFFIHEEPIAEKPQGTYWGQLADSFHWKTLVENREFFLVLLGISLWAIAQNIFFPYLIIYLQHYVQLDTTSSSITIAACILIGGIALAYPFGLLVDRWGRKPVALLAVAAEMIGLILFSLVKSLVPLIITGILWLGPLTAWTIATGTWSKDLFPDDKRGQFAGFYLFFWVMLPMILGPLTGGWLGTTYGIKTVIDGQAAYIPTPLLFQVAGAATLLAAIPLFLTKKQKSTGK